MESAAPEHDTLRGREQAWNVPDHRGPVAAGFLGTLRHGFLVVGLASEDVTVTVGEASLSISGTARLAADGSPVPGLALRLGGVPKHQLTGYTDIQGRFRFDDLVRGRRYRLRPTRPSNREYRTNPRELRVTSGASDIAGLDLAVSPK